MTKSLLKNIVTSEKLLGLGDSEELKPFFLIFDKSSILDILVDEPMSFSGDIIDGGGFFLSPGLCDPQVHFREPGFEYKEDIMSGSIAANKGGFTSVVSMPNTLPTADNKEVVSFMWEQSQKTALCDVYPTGAVSIGLKGETLTDFQTLKDAGAIALTDDGKGIQSDDLFYNAMVNAKKVNLALLDHSEDESLSDGGCIHKGEVSKKYNLKGIDSNSEAVHVERGCKVSLETGAHFHVLHVSTKRSIEAVKKAKEAGAKVTVEVSPHHLLLCDEDIPELADGKLNANWKMNPPLRSKEDRAACVEALKSGLIDAIATDHAPHSPEEKSLPIDQAPFGIIGLETAFPLIYTNFVKTGDISLLESVDLMSKKAGALFGLDIGSLSVGSKPNMALFDLDSKFVVTEDFFASKSKNSPFTGRSLLGETKLTIFEGKIVYNNL